MPDPHLLAADADRAAVADVLGASLSAGRLTVAEFDERLTRAWAARTYGELAELTVDLPPVAPAAVPAPPPAARPVPRAAALAAPWCGGWSGGHQVPAGHSWHAWRVTSAVVLAIWLLTSLAGGELQPFWPGWVIGPWGSVLVLSTLTGSAARRGRLTG